MGKGMDEVSLKITDIGANGDGIARMDNGQTVFVPFAATGDVVLANVAKDRDVQSLEALKLSLKREEIEQTLAGMLVFAGPRVHQRCF